MCEINTDNTVCEGGRKMNWWIKERHNPQFTKPYYTGCGQLSKRAARKHEQPLCGENVMIAFTSKRAYLRRLDELRAAGNVVFDCSVASAASADGN